MLIRGWNGVEVGMLFGGCGSTVEYPHNLSKLLDYTANSHMPLKYNVRGIF